MDLNTLSDSSSGSAKVERGRYDRICVELDFQMKLVLRIIAAEEVFNVEYEDLNLICLDCGRYGHRRECCPWKRNIQLSQANTESRPPSSNSPELMPKKEKEALNEPFGPWMFVSKNGRARGSRREAQRYGGIIPKVNQNVIRKENMVATKTRFAVLENIEAEETIEKEMRNDKGERSEQSDKVGSIAVWVKKKAKKAPMVGEASTSGLKEKKSKSSTVNGKAMVKLSK